MVLKKELPFFRRVLICNPFTSKSYDGFAMDQSAYNASMFLYKSDQYEEVHMGNPIYNPFKFNGDVTRVNAEVRLVNGLGAENIAIQINDC